jgi:hypothetical protein
MLFLLLRGRTYHESLLRTRRYAPAVKKKTLPQRAQRTAEEKKHWFYRSFT